MLNPCRRVVLIAVVILWIEPSHLFAQTASTGSGLIKCASCPLANQKPNTSRFDESLITFVGELKPAFHQGLTVQTDIIARVLLTSPLVVEVLDGRTRLLDRNMRPNQAVDDPEEFTCSISRIEAIDIASKPILASLRFNDLLRATMVWQQDEAQPGDILATTPVLAAMSRATAPVRYFHPQASTACQNRSGRLVEYRGISGDTLTVYNDGAVEYRDSLFGQFERERLSAQELSDFLRVFGTAHFDGLPEDSGQSDRNPRPGITLLAVRYQDVRLAGNDTALAPLLRRINDLAKQATSHSYLVLKAGSRQRITTEPWPYARVSLEGFRGRRDSALMKRQSGASTSPDAQEFEQQIPDEFLARLPLKIPMVATANDPNRFRYFSQADKLYRVTHNPNCSEVSYCKSFYHLDVEEVQSVEVNLRAQATRTLGVHGTTAGAEPQSLDSARLWELRLALTGPGPFLWASDMGISLAALPPSGAIIGEVDYEKHKPEYFAIFKNLETGVDLIEDGILFEHVRVCRMHVRLADNCEVK